MPLTVEQLKHADRLGHKYCNCKLHCEVVVSTYANGDQEELVMHLDPPIKAHAITSTDSLELLLAALRGDGIIGSYTRNIWLGSRKKPNGDGIQFYLWCPIADKSLAA